MDHLIRLTGAVALLVWGTFMVKTGMLRTFGEHLREWLSRTLSNRFSGFAAGVGLASLLQSSTASALLVAGLQGSGLVSTAIALSAVLGADLGSAIMARVLSLDLSLLSPVLIASGTFLFLKKGTSRSGQFGRVLLGLGFILLALTFIMAATAPLKQSPAVATAFAAASDSAVLSFVAGALLALMCFSSLAVVIIVSSLVTAGLLTGEGGLWFALGANFGSALLAVITTAGGTPEARRAPFGNLVFRSAGVAFGTMILLAVPAAGTLFAGLPDGVIWFHLSFNLALGAVGLFFISPVGRLAEMFYPTKSRGMHAEVKLMNEENLMNLPSALRLAEAEVKHTAELLSAFWKDAARLVTENPPSGEVLLLLGRKKFLERRCRDVSRFLAALMTNSLGPDEIVQWQRIRNANACMKLASASAAGFIKTLDKQKCRKNLFFSHDGAQELLTQHSRTLANLTRLCELLGTEDDSKRRELQTRLLQEKNVVEESELSFIASHMRRLSQGLVESMETSTLHVELLTKMRRFNTLICSQDELSQ